MITNIILLVLIAIIFYLIIKSVKDRFQNALCSYRYDKNNLNECSRKCNISKDPACDANECKKRCIQFVNCNNKDYKTCDFYKCNWSADKKKCEVPRNTYFLKDNQSLSFKNNMKLKNINNSFIKNPTKFKSFLTLMDLNGNDSFIHISDFYSKNSMISFFFEIRDKTGTNSIPLISTIYWNVELRKIRNSINYKLIINSSKTGNIAFPAETYPLSIKPRNLYSFGLIINNANNTANILVYDLMKQNNDINDEGLKIKNFIYSETPSILIGTNGTRTSFMDGRIGDLKITREISDLSIIKRNTYLFSDDDILALAKGKVVKIDSIAEKEVPGVINFIGKKVNTNFVLYWSPPEQGKSSLKYYIIILKDLTNNKYYTFLQRNDNCNECTYKLATLEEDTNYSVGITAINNRGIQTTVNFITIRLEGSSGASNDNGVKNEFIFKNDKISNKISCNPDGSYSIGKKCNTLTNERIVSNLDNNDFRNILENLSKQRVLDASVDFKISL